MRWLVIVSRTVDPFDPRSPVVIGPFKDEFGAGVKRARIVRGLERAGVDRDVYIVPLEPGATSARDIAEYAA